MTLAKPLLGIATLVTVLAIPGLAAAQTCVSDSDCAPGLTCQGSAVTPTPAPACPTGADCPTAVPPAPSTTCQPAPCQTDADCGQRMVCHSQTTTTCSGGSASTVKCDPNTVCDSTPPTTAPVCTDTTTSQCTYKWQLPCNADADCGDGFECQPTTMGMCSGGSGSAGSGSTTSSSGAGGGSGSGGLALPPSPAPDGGTSVVCTTVTSYPGSCQPKVSTCNVDSDCPSTWKCVASAVLTTTEGGAPVPTDGGATTAVQNPTATTTATSTATTVSTCQSPVSYPPRTVGLTGNGTGTSQTTDTTPSTADAGATTKGASTPIAQPGVNTSTDTKTTAMATGGGCSLGAGALTGGPAVILGLFGALFVLRTRRRRQG